MKDKKLIQILKKTIKSKLKKFSRHQKIRTNNNLLKIVLHSISNKINVFTNKRNQFNKFYLYRNRKKLKD